MCRDADIQHRFSAVGPGLRNSLPSHLKDADLSYNEFQRSTKDISVWTVGPRRSVNFINCAD